jgi:hypothetical protein
MFSFFLYEEKFFSFGWEEEKVVPDLHMYLTASVQDRY